MRTLEINGNDFCSLDGFYKVIEKSLILGDCPWGENLDSLEEIVLYNFNYTDNPENDVNSIIWTNFQKSQNEITEKRGNRLVIDIIDEIFKRNETIKFIKNNANT